MLARRLMNSWQIKDYLEAVSGRLHIDGVDAVELGREFSTPLFIFSERRIRRNIARIKSVQASVPFNLKVCYAAKAMSTMGILRAVRDAGSDIEVNSGGELWKALEAGFTGDQIVFNGTSKEVWEIEAAINAGIYAIQVDSLYELSLISATAERLGSTARASLRFVPQIESGTHSGLQTALLTSKFGMMPDEAFEAFRLYSASRHVDLCGIHLHVGSQNPDPIVYTQALETLYSALKRIRSETGRTLSHVNIGGGFPVNYLNDEARGVPDDRQEMFAADFDPAAALSDAWAAIREEVEQDALPDIPGGLTLVVEPGRSIIADAAVCLTTVQNRKVRPVASPGLGEPETDEWLLTDAGFNILLSMETYKWYYHLLSAERSDNQHMTPYKVAGPLCDGGDVYFDIEGEGRLPEHRFLPEGVEPGEMLALLNCGAYSLAQASQYNGRFLPAVILIRDDGTPELIRRRDTLADLVSADIY